MVSHHIMSLHLIKLCVGVKSIEDLESWIVYRAKQAQALGKPFEHIHVTRMMPKQKDALLEQGSLFWVIQGLIQARQRLLDIRPVTDDKGTKRCALVLEPRVIPTQRQPRRPFQGWRYFEGKDAPNDLLEPHVDSQALQAELSALGLL